MTTDELQQIVINVMKKTQNPGRIKVGLCVDRNFCGIFSRKGTNDTSDWYMVNSPMIESEIKKAGLSWYYLFETIKGDYPGVTMIIGENINAQTGRDLMTELLGYIPDNDHFDDGTYKDVCDNYREISALERVLTQESSTVIRILEP